MLHENRLTVRVTCRVSPACIMLCKAFKDPSPCVIEWVFVSVKGKHKYSKDCIQSGISRGDSRISGYFGFGK